MKKLRGAIIGAGYFSRFHVDAWARMPDVEIVGICDAELARCADAARAFVQPPELFTDAATMLDALALDFVDIVTPPATHAALCGLAAQRGLAVICQKPLAPTVAEASAIAAQVQVSGMRLMVHENFRWQPWHVEIRRLVESGLLGRVHAINVRSRLGDGWGDDAYLARQPYFRDYPRLLIYETGVHFIDTFRALLGGVTSVYARIARHNPLIKGEDAGLMVLGFASGATAVWDANRYNESDAADPRYTFGEIRVDAEKGHLEVDALGSMQIKLLGQPTRKHDYPLSHHGFGGDCVLRTQQHFIEGLRTGAPFATSAQDYVETMRVMERCYESANQPNASHNTLPKALGDGLAQTIHDHKNI